MLDFLVLVTKCAYHPVDQAVHLDPVVAGGGPGELVVLMVGEKNWGRWAAMQLYEYSAKVQNEQDLRKNTPHLSMPRIFTAIQE